MIKFNLKDILQRNEPVDLLIVHSFEMNIYFVEIHLDSQHGFIYGDKDNPQRFHSSQHIRDVFEGITVKKSVMQHD